MTDISRRDFLRLMAMTPMAMLVQPLLKPSNLLADPNQKNIIVIVLDTWSADHMALYGYPRQTMPNLEKFADSAIVYHHHYAPATFTVPGTASLLTGLHPWTHRAILLGGEIIEKHRNHQFFNLLAPTYSTLGYAQNKYADLFLYQAGRGLETHIPINSFSLEHGLIYSLPIFRNDSQAAFASFEDDIFQPGVGFDGSLFLGPLRRLFQWRQREALNSEYRMSFPRGLPDSTELFRLEDVVDGAIRILDGLSSPSLAYLHLYPPHGPYRPKGKYNKEFDDGWRAPVKPVHPIAQDVVSYDEQENQRRKYDQYLANWDAEIVRLLDHLKSSGLFDSSFIIITSDHGELFERGEVGHNGFLIYDPLVHVPLIISRPGQKERIDVQAATSNVDLISTIANWNGSPQPDWAEGQLLPEFGGVVDENRSIFSMDAKTNSAFAPLTKVSISLARNNHRLTYYQYDDLSYRGFELYDIAEDPNELNNLYPARPSIAFQMQDELLQKLADVNRPFHG